jgi:hypothetical protein
MKQGWMPPPPSARKYTPLTRRSWEDWYVIGRITYYLF